MRRIVYIFLSILLIFVAVSCKKTAYASETYLSKEDLDVYLEELDLSKIDELYQQLNIDNGLLSNNIKDYIQSAINANSFDISYLFSDGIAYLEKIFSHYSGVFFVLLLIILALSIICNFKPRIAKDSITTIIGFSSSGIIGGILLFVFVNLVEEISLFVRYSNTILHACFPAILTIITTLGGVSTATSCELIASGYSSIVVSVIQSIIVPIIIVISVVYVLSNVSKSEGLINGCDSVIKLIRWILIGLFVIFSFIFSIQTIVVGVKESISVRVARFSLSKYVPIIGGYLSSGFNYLFATGVGVKNAIGVATIIFLTIILLPIVLKIGIISILLKVLNVFASTLQENNVSKMISGFDKTLSLLVTVVIGVSVCMLVMSAGVITSANYIFW